MVKSRYWKLLAAVALLVATPVAFATFPPPPPQDPAGLTPGFWKNHVEFWEETTNPWTGDPYEPDDALGVIFNFDGDSFGSLPDKTLLDALSFKGGPGIDGARRVLLRTASAAVLNAGYFNGNDPDLDYPLEWWEIIFMVSSELHFGNRDSLLDLADLLDDMNNIGAPD